MISLIKFVLSIDERSHPMTCRRNEAGVFILDWFDLILARVRIYFGQRQRDDDLSMRGTKRERERERENGRDKNALVDEVLVSICTSIERRIAGLYYFSCVQRIINRVQQGNKASIARAKKEESSSL